MSKYSTKIIAIIPVRGGSVGIPRKNVRIMGGKPLLAYSIENCLDAKEIDEVFVSTEDTEVAEVAIRFGAKVLDRPELLADSRTTLDEVIVHSVKQLEESGKRISFIVTVQATSPHIKPVTIDCAIRKCRQKQYDTVLSVTENTHLSWTDGEAGQLVPAYSERLNRQELPQRYQETGGVVVCSRKTLEMNSRFGHHVGVVKVKKAEAIDIDDYFDWWLVEKSLQRKRICFHVIGNKKCGLGHVYRVLTLADRLVDHDLWFLVNEESQLARKIIEDRFYQVITVSPGHEVRTILVDKPDLVINDILDTDESYMQGLTQEGIVNVNFEDLGAGASYANYVINSMYDDPISHTHPNMFSGVRYCCLRDEFYSIKARETAGQVKNILVLFGGTDPGDLTLKILNWLDQIEGDWSITVILGVGFDKADEIYSFVENASHHVDIIHKTKIISRYMSKADIAITSSGRTVYELGSLEVPVLSVAVNEREMTHDFVKNSPGVIFLGSAEQLTQEKFTHVVGQVVYSDILRYKMSHHLQSSGIRQGINNVLNIIESALHDSVGKALE